MTSMEFSEIQRLLGVIEGASFTAAPTVTKIIGDAVEAIDSILSKETLTDIK